MAPLITDDLVKIDPTLKGIKQLAPNVAWMNGLQIFLKREVKIARGHLNHTDSKWALTSVSQRQFWIEFPDYAGGEVQGIISVDISDWNFEGVNGHSPLIRMDEIFPLKKINTCTTLIHLYGVVQNI